MTWTYRLFMLSFYEYGAFSILQITSNWISALESSCCRSLVTIVLIPLIYRFLSMSLREKCLYSEFFWSVCSRIWTEYGEIRSITPYSVQMRENTDQKNSKYEHFSCSVSRDLKMMTLSVSFKLVGHYLVCFTDLTVHL